MNRINLNLAAKPRFRPGRLLCCALLTIAASVLFTSTAVSKFSTSLSEYSKWRQLEKESRQSLQRIQASSAPLRRTLSGNRKKWDNQVQIANNLIDGKKFSFIKQLDFLEEILIEGTWLQRLTLKNDKNRRINLVLSADSFESLLRQYEKMLPFELVIRAESEKGNLLQADLALSPENE